MRPRTKGRTRKAEEILKLVFVDQAKIDSIMQQIGKSPDLPHEVLQAYDLEWHGGDCPVCGRAWVPVQAKVELPKLKVAFADFLYFKPNCHCFQKCTRGYTREGRYRPGCGRLMVEERLLGIRRCVNCGAQLPKPKEAEAPK